VITASAAAITGSSATISGAGPCTLTLPHTAAVGTWLHLVSTTPQIVQSAGVDVVPITGNGAGSAIFGASSPHWCILQFDGTNWITFAGA
jgi:hypothetical protein